MRRYSIKIVGTNVGRCGHESLLRIIAGFESQVALRD